MSRQIKTFLKKAEAAKILLIVKHGEQSIIKTHIFTKLDASSREQHLLKQVDILFDQVQKELIFNSNNSTKFTVTFLTKQEQENLSNPSKDANSPMASSTVPHFDQLNLSETIYRGDSRAHSFVHRPELLATPHVSRAICELAEIPVVPQIDAQGNFI